jgi:large subunit ribosomal protein L23
VLLITEEIDRNLALSSRNLTNVEILAVRNTESRVAGPLARGRADAQGDGEARGDARMTAAKKYAAERLMNVVIAPVVSEKSTRVADKHRQYVFRVADGATKPEIKAAVELMFKTSVESVTITNVKGKEEALRTVHGPTPQLEEGVRAALRQGRKSTSRRRSKRCHWSRSNPHRRAAEAWSRSSRRGCTRASRTGRSSRPSRRASAATTLAASRCGTRAAATSSTIA